MEFFKTKQHLEDVNQEVQRILWNLGEKQGEEVVDQLELINKRKQFMETFNGFYHANNFQGLFKFMIDHCSHLNHNQTCNLYLMILFYTQQAIGDQSNRIEIIDFLNQQISQKSDKFLVIKVQSMFFNFLSFNPSEQKKYLLQMLRISQESQEYFLYEYFKNPQNIIDVSLFSNEELLEFYLFALSKARNMNLNDYEEILTKILGILDKLKKSESYEQIIKNNLEFILTQESVIFKIDDLKQFHCVKDLIKNKKIDLDDQINKLKKGETKVNGKLFLFCKIVALAEKKIQYSFSEIEKELYGSESEENHRNLCTLLISAGRLKYFEVKIDQKKKLVSFRIIRKGFYSELDKQELVKEFENLKINLN